MKQFKKGRGAQINVPNRFLKEIHHTRDDFLNYCHSAEEAPEDVKTRYIEVHPKTIVNKITSPDVSMPYSMNPYQGCEHGCIYCYARNSHEYWGYSAGKDFENRILVKQNAPDLLAKKLRSKSWEAAPIIMSGNTDCYQPAESKFKLTRSCLEVFYRFRHPVGIITKNALVLRDLDLLEDLNRDGLTGVTISVTTLSEKTRRILEPRTATIAKRLQTMERLSSRGIPVNAMLAPIIPGINSHEILNLAKAVSDAGALSFGFTVVRLNGAIGTVFTNWIKQALPHKADKVLNQIAACHGGSLNDSRWGVRKRGEGTIATQIHDMVRIAKQRYFKGTKFPELNTSLYPVYREGQLRLF